MQAAGAGEILLTSMDRDGTKAGFDVELTRAFSEALDIPVIASGGVGSLQHLVDGIVIGKADAVLAASVFHYGELTVQAGETVHGATQHRGAAVSDAWLDEVAWDEQGLVPAIAQEVDTGKLLMLAWMNREALAETVRSGRAVYWSRSRHKLVAQGRGIRTRPAGQGNQARLRWRCRGA